VVYPHTSNWDFIVACCSDRQRAAGELDRQGPRCSAPFTGLLKWLGGIPIDRRRVEGVCRGDGRGIPRRDWMWVAIAPEGTRSHNRPPQVGFLQIAVAADVRCAGLHRLRHADARHRHVHPHDRRPRRDMAQIRASYADKRGTRRSWPGSCGCGAEAAADTERVPGLQATPVYAAVLRRITNTRAGSGSYDSSAVRGSPEWWARTIQGVTRRPRRPDSQRSLHPDPLTVAYLSTPR